MLSRDLGYVKQCVHSRSKLDKCAEICHSGYFACDNFSNCKIDFIALSNEAKYSYLDFLASYKRNVDYMTTDTGFKAISFGGVPMVFERFVDSGEMYMIDTSTLKLHQLCDWRYLENENGKILRQMQGKPTYTATLVKYCDLICARPNGQAKLTGLTAPQANEA